MDNAFLMPDSTPSVAREQYAPIARVIAITYSFLFCVIGTALNGTSLFILFRHKRHVSTTGVFLTCLAIVDTVVLYTAILDAINSEILPIGLRTIWLCRFSSFVQGSAQMLSSWILVAVLIDRFMAVKYPHVLFTRRMSRNARITCCVLATVATGYSMHIWWLVYEADGSCRPNHIGYPAWTAISWVSVTLYCFLPSVIVIVTSFMIIRAMRQKSRDTAVIIDNNHHSSLPTERTTIDSQEQPNSRRYVSLLLLVVTFGFVICTVPSASCLAMEMSLGSEVCPATSVEDLIINEAVSYGLAYVNHSCKVLVYMCSWDYFRTALSALLCACCCKKKSYNRAEIGENNIGSGGNETLTISNL